MIQDEDTKRVVDQSKLFVVLKEAERPLMMIGVVPHTLLSRSFYVWVEVTRDLRLRHVRELRKLWKEYIPEDALLNAYIRGEKQCRFAEFFGFVESPAKHPEPDIKIYAWAKK